MFKVSSINIDIDNRGFLSNETTEFQVNSSCLESFFFNKIEGKIPFIDDTMIFNNIDTHEGVAYIEYLGSTVRDVPNFIQKISYEQINTNNYTTVDLKYTVKKQDKDKIFEELTTLPFYEEEMRFEEVIGFEEEEEEYNNIFYSLIIYLERGVL